MDLPMKGFLFHIELHLPRQRTSRAPSRHLTIPTTNKKPEHQIKLYWGLNKNIWFFLESGSKTCEWDKTNVTCK